MQLSNRFSQGATAGDGICVARGSWTFGGQTAQVFDRHIRRSVPGYAELHELTLALSQRFVPRLGRIVDLGCSIGTLTARLQQDHPQATVWGLDSEPEMIERARLLHPSVTFRCEDVRTLPDFNAHFVVCLFVLQFVPPADRLAVLERLRCDLEPEGALLIAEKTRQDDAQIELRVRAAYRAFKIQQGYTEAEILAKEQSLEGVLIPLSARENLELLERAGFIEIEPVFSRLGFEAWLARVS